jgi:hypothetical protein
MNKSKLFFIVLFASFSTLAQVEKSSELYKTILNLDKELFDTYNTCSENLEKHASFYSEEIEFFHDKGGLSTSKEEIIEAIKKNICGKVTRDLVADSIEIHEIPNYGVVVIGFHKFNSLIEKSTSDPSKFILFWKHTDSNWKLAKVVSLH